MVVAIPSPSHLNYLCNMAWGMGMGDGGDGKRFTPSQDPDSSLSSVQSSILNTLSPSLARSPGSPVPRCILQPPGVASCHSPPDKKKPAHGPAVRRACAIERGAGGKWEGVTDHSNRTLGKGCNFPRDVVNQPERVRGTRRRASDPRLRGRHIAWATRCPLKLLACVSLR